MKQLFFVLIFFPGFFKVQTVCAQATSPIAKTNKPKLVVGIVVDQMRNDYIYRYWNRYGNGGFRRLVNEGFYFKNAHYNYIPTYTGPGHGSIYTGATPKTHGIIANDWFEKITGTFNYCVEDTNMRTVGAPGKKGWMSPHRLVSSTIGDEMKMSSNQRSKVYAIALKDRSSVLPAGHMADAAFWYDDATGNFISSTWYLKELPQWLNDFNNRQLPKTYLSKGWETLFALNTYTSSIEDENNYEFAPNKKPKAVFPYNYTSFLQKNNYGIVEETPYGNTLTKDLAIACIAAESMGKDEVTDLLALSFSSTDHVGHYYGPRSVEVEDVYLRLDRDLEELFNFLDKQVGKGQYTVFLSADHGGADIPAHLADHKVGAGYIRTKQLASRIKKYFWNSYGDSLLLASVSNEQVFINDGKLSDLKLDKSRVEEALAIFLTGIKGIAEAYPSAVVKAADGRANNYLSLLANGYNQKRSGDVCFIYEPAWMEKYPEKVVTHGTGYNYDTHVPILFYGTGIKKGQSYQYTTITQIAPTVCELLQVNQPNSTIAAPLNDFLK